MPKYAHKPATIRESWRPDSANAEQQANRQRAAWRWLITTVLILSFVTFGYLLFGPLFHPTLRLYYLTAGSYEVMDVKPIPFFQEDAVRFLSIDGSFRKEDAATEFSLMESPAVVREYLLRMINSDAEKSDIALLQVSAQPILEGDRPFLKCANFNRASPESGSFSVEELLNQLDRMTVGLTIICLNLGPSDSKAVEDFARDDFIYNLHTLMKSRKNPNQWILVSNSPTESSYVSMELRSSVFSYAVTQALQGGADFNRDAVIDLDEFTRFVVGFTQAQVQRESDGNSQQTPVLITTGSNAASTLSLIPIASTPRPGINWSWWANLTSWWSADEEQDAKAESEKIAEKAKKEKNWLTEYLERSSTRIQEITMEEIEDNIDFLPTSLGERVKKTVGLQDEEDITTSKTPTQDPASKQTAAEGSQSSSENSASATEGKSPGDETAVAETTGGADSQPSTPTVQSRPVDKSIPDISRLADPASSNLQLLQLVWQFCDYLELPQEGAVRPLDVAPHAWNEFVSHFHGIEERLRTDSVVDAKTTRLQLTSEIVGAYQFAMTGRARVGAQAKRVSDQMPTLALSSPACTSVGLAERLAEFGGPPVPSTLATQTQQFDNAIKSESTESFDKWSSQVSAELSSQYVELFWAQQFGARTSTPWKMTRQALGLWRQYERLAFDPMASNFSIQQSLASSQSALLEGTRLALDQIGGDWTTRCQAALDKAELSLKTASAQRDQLRSAFQLRNQVLAELPSLLQWRKLAVTRLGSTQLDDDLERMLQILSKLCVQLQDRENCELNELVRNHDSLKFLTERISGYWIEESNELVAGEPKSSSSTNWFTDSLLATSLNRSPLRNRLLALPISTALPAATEIDSDAKISPLSRIRSENKNTQLQIRFESLAAILAGMDADIAAMEDVQIAIEIDGFYKTLADRILQSFSRFSMSTPAPELATQLQALRSADQALRLLPALESQSLDGKPLESRLWELEILQRLIQQQLSTQKSVQDALPQEVQFLTNAGERLAFLASRLSRTPQLASRAAPGLSIRGTTNISLLTEPQASGEVVLQNVGTSINSVWLLVDYDPSVLELTGPTGIQLHQVSKLPVIVDTARRQAEQQLLMAIAAGADTQDGQKAIEDGQRRVETLSRALGYPIHPESCMVAPSMGLAAGQVVKIPFKVRRIGPGLSQSKLIWKLVGGEDYVRHEIITQLPEAEKLKLVVDSEANSWGRTNEGVELFLWPNRPTEFRFGLRNESGKPRALSAELLAVMSRREVTLPDGFLTPAAASEIADRLGPLKPLAVLPDVAIDSRSDTVWLNLQKLSSGEPTVAGAPPKEQTPIPTDHGLVLVFTEKVTNQKYWRRVDTRVRHPRSYIEPTVRFDAASERAEIKLTARASGVPDAGIEVVGRILEQLPRGTEMKLEGSLLSGESLTLYCQVPTGSARELTFEIDADGFPRAFVIKVPCWRTNLDIPAISDFQSIEFAEPRQELSIGPKETGQKLRLKIDTMPGAFETKRDYVEVGWDLDRDREFAGETTVKFAAERQVDALVNSILNGRMSMTAKVRDIELELPLPSLKNQRVNLLARLYAAGEMVWSKPIEIIADFDPPTITGVEIVPGTTFMQGVDLQIRVGVDDARLSGIATVEVKLDSKGVGKFTDSAAVAQVCVRESDSSWILALPTADLVPGRATLFVRATDRVGNVSEDSKTLLTILSEQEWQDQLQSATQELSGTVLYADAPLPRAKVTLENEKGAVAYTSVTDERGAFRVLGVQTGKYKIAAVGVMKNRPRQAEQVVEVVGPQAPPLRLRLIAK